MMGRHKSEHSQKLIERKLRMEREWEQRRAESTPLDIMMRRKERKLRLQRASREFKERRKKQEPTIQSTLEPIQEGPSRA